MQRDLLSSSCVQHQPAGVYAAGSSKVTQGDTAYMIRPVHYIRPSSIAENDRLTSLQGTGLCMFVFQLCSPGP